MYKIWQSIRGYVEGLWMDGSYGEQFKHWCFGERKVERLNINITGNGSGNGKSNVNGKGVVIVMAMVYDNSKIKQLSVVLYIIYWMRKVVQTGENVTRMWKEIYGYVLGSRMDGSEW